MLFLNEEIVEVALLGEFVAEAYSIVVDTEAQNHSALILTGRQTGAVRIAGKTVEPLLRQGDGVLVVVIADGSGLTPDGTPRLVECRGFFLGDSKTFHEVVLTQTHRGVFVLSQLETKVRGLNDGSVLIGHLVNRLSKLAEREFQLDIPIGRLYPCCHCHQWQY